MGLILNGTNQYYRIYSAAMGNPALWHSDKVHTVVVVFKANLSVATERAILVGCNTGGLWRQSGAVFRGNQSPKYISKKKSSGDFYYPNASTGFVPSSDWNVFIFSRSATGAGVGASRRRLNGGAASTTNSEENSLSDLSMFLGGAVRNGDGTFSNHFEGEYAVVAQWDRVLSSTEEDELFAFTRPEDVSGGAPNFLVEFSGSGTAANFTTPTGHIINFTGSPTLTADTPYVVPAVSSVNGGAGIRAGSTGNTAQTTSYTNDITGGSFGGKAITVTGYNSTTKVVTFDFPAYADGVSYPNPLNTHTLTLTSSTETASLTGQQMLLPVDHGSVIAASIVTGNDRYLPYWDTGAANGDYWIFPQETVPAEDDPTQPENFEIYADGEPRAATTGARTIWRYDISASNFVRIDAVVTSAGEIIPDAEITSAGTIRIGGTAPVTVTGFGTVNAGTLDGKALTAASNTSITMAALADGVATYRPGARTLSLTDGTKTGTLSRDVLPPSGWGAYTITGDFVQAINGVAATYLPSGWASTDFILYPLSPSSGKTTTVGDAGVVTGNVGTQELFLVDAATGMATAFDVVTTAGAGSVGIGGSNLLRSKYLKGAYL